MNLFKTTDSYQGYDKEKNENSCIVFSKYEDKINYMFYSKDIVCKLYENDKKGVENRPDLTYYKKDDVKVSVWFKKTKNGDRYLSTSVEYLNEKNNNFTNPPDQPDLTNDNIPF